MPPPLVPGKRKSSTGREFDYTFDYSTLANPSDNYYPTDHPQEINIDNNLEVNTSPYAPKGYTSPIKDANIHEGSIEEYKKPSGYKQFMNKAANPLSALTDPSATKVGYAENPYDIVLGMINPFTWAREAHLARKNFQRGHYGEAALNALGASPVLGAAGKFGPKIANKAFKRLVYEAASSSNGAPTLNASALKLAFLEAKEFGFKNYFGPTTNNIRYTGTFNTNGSSRNLVRQYVYGNSPGMKQIPRPEMPGWNWKKYDDIYGDIKAFEMNVSQATNKNRFRGLVDHYIDNTYRDVTRGVTNDILNVSKKGAEKAFKMKIPDNVHSNIIERMHELAKSSTLIDPSRAYSSSNYFDLLRKELGNKNFNRLKFQAYIKELKKGPMRTDTGALTTAIWKDDIAGHLEQAFIKNNKLEYHIDDIWKFLPDEYLNRWVGTSGDPSIKDIILTKAMEKSGSPFSLHYRLKMNVPNRY